MIILRRTFFIYSLRFNIFHTAGAGAAVVHPHTLFPLFYRSITIEFSLRFNAYSFVLVSPFYSNAAALATPTERPPIQHRLAYFNINFHSLFVDAALQQFNILWNYNMGFSFSYYIMYFFPSKHKKNEWMYWCLDFFGVFRAIDKMNVKIVQK